MARPIKVRVVRASGTGFWYVNRIGEEFKVYRDQFCIVMGCYKLCKSDLKKALEQLKEEGDEQAIKKDILALTLMQNDCEVIS